MLELGQKVNYIRQKIDTEEVNGKRIIKGQSIVEGEAVVIAVCLDPSKRKMVQLKEESNIFNVDYNNINPSQEYKAAFEKHCSLINDLSEVGRQEQQKIVNEYNDKIELANNLIFGNPIEL